MTSSQRASFALAALWLVSCAPRPPSPTASLTQPRRTLETQTSTSDAPVPPLAILPLEATRFELYGLVELDLLTSIVPENPFDPEELDMRVEFTSPSGSKVDVGAFWYQAFEAALGTPEGDPGWKVRFTPTETGAWTAVARVPARSLESDSITFEVLPSDHPGFVRIHRDHPRYFAFDNGQFFFPVGLNLAWWTQTGNALTDYRKWMSPFSANGGDVIRVWMADWSFAIEGVDTRLGNYEKRLKRAWYLDRIFEFAESLDVYVLLVLLNCADYNDWQTNGWNMNPYNADRGGPLDHPAEFVTNAEARALLQRKLNYIVNRWGYSPRLFAWEWWNEVNLTPFSDEALIPWFQEMTAYLRARDVNRHLTTNSYAIKDVSITWTLPELDIIQKHEYSDQTGSEVRDLAERAAADFERLAASAPPKPILLGEFGFGGEDRGELLDQTGIHLHNGLWATTFVGYAGSGMYWFWDIYVERYNLWYHFRGLDRFLEDIDLTTYEPFSPLQISGPAGAEAVGLGLRGEDLLVWIRSNAYTGQAAEAEYRRAGSGAFTYSPPVVEGQRLTLSGMEDGLYSIRWYDPQRGQWLDPAEAAADDGLLVVSIPSLRRDLAARIVRQP
ncbi:MAG TPA: DUF5060 domain-containing protein [Anaerolineales bacterium]|nr:DUF5060 domain-containing protein [Anaerolineales bacterium]